MKKFSNSGGFIQIILIVVAALVLLKYVYNIDVVGFLTTGWFKGLLDNFYGFGTKGWAKYSDVITGVWNWVVGLVKNLLDKVRG